MVGDTLEEVADRVTWHPTIYDQVYLNIKIKTYIGFKFYIHTGPKDDDRVTWHPTTYDQVSLNHVKVNFFDLQNNC